MISRLASKQSVTIALLLTIALIIGACNRQETQTLINGTVQSTPIPELSPGCRPVPQMTAEKIIEATVEATPQPQIAAGETLSFTFSGNYAIQNNQIVCGFKVVDYYRSDDELPGFDWDREIIIWMDDQVLETEPQVIERVDCDFTCTVKVKIPADTLPGIYTLEAENLDGPLLMRFDFVVEITEPNQ